MKFQKLILLWFVSAACTGVSGEPTKAPQPIDPTDPTTPVDPPQIVTGDKHLFVTSKAYQGDLGGLAGADAKCAAHAAAGGLAGTYKAWLSDTHKSAASRLTHATGTYSLIDGTVVAASWDDLVATNLQHAIDHDELGHPYTATLTCSGSDTVPVWTQTTIKGDTFSTRALYGCADWTEISHNGAAGDALVGNVLASDSFWTEGPCGLGCPAYSALYCLEQ